MYYGTLLDNKRTPCRNIVPAGLHFISGGPPFISGSFHFVSGSYAFTGGCIGSPLIGLRVDPGRFSRGIERFVRGPGRSVSDQERFSRDPARFSKDQERFSRDHGRSVRDLTRFIRDLKGFPGASIKVGRPLRGFVRNPEVWACSIAGVIN